ncbi:MAG: type I restriction endonuclease subunit R [Prevotella sp.]|nr:type I restriction endonuclease subunit R [Prevotella sp.]
MSDYNEDHYEQTLIELFTEKLGYDYLSGYDIQSAFADKDYYCPVYLERLRTMLQRLNPKMPQAALDEAERKLMHIEAGNMVQNNEVFMDYLQHGIEVTFHDGRELRNDLVYLADYKDVGRNDFLLVNQWTYVEKSKKRADLILFLNGLPVVLMELKSPSREETDASAAYRQLKNYMKEIPTMFTYNAFCVMSDMTESKAGTITSNEDRYMQWKSKDGIYESSEVVDFDVFFEGMFRKERLLDILKNFVCYCKDEGKDYKILAGYHQYFAVNKAIQRTRNAVVGDGKIGVFWHTQGSGKSLSMVFYAHLLQSAVTQPTIVVITDRNDLDNQLYGQFAKCKDFLRQVPVQATSRQHLRELLEGRTANGIIFTTMQKFEDYDAPLSTRRNIIVMSDEAHRGQYGFEEKIDPETGRVSVGTARLIHDSLPHASFIGFTGTPVALKDRNTIEVFGDCIDVYDMTQSVLDHATVPVYYESRVINLRLDEETLRLIDQEYEQLEAEGAEEQQLEKSKHDLSHLEELLGADSTINSLVEDILHHYENYREQELSGKAMIVAYSRPIAIKIYKRLLELRPGWEEKVKCVMTSGNDDPEEWRNYIGNKQYKLELAKKFKDDDDPMKIAIVVDMWLTGFDVPSLATMYVFKPMSGHNLMQAIARVNRVFKGKSGGLVVDYIGIAQALKEAMKFYSTNDRKKFGDPDIKKTALKKFQEELEICRDMMHGYDYSLFKTASDLKRAEIIKGGTNFLLAVDKQQQKADFLKHATLLHQSITLCRSLLSEAQRWESAYFETVRVMLMRLGGKGNISKKDIDRRVRELMKQSVKSEGVINLFGNRPGEEFSLNDPAFLEELAKMKEKNISVQILENLLKEKVKAFQHKNLVQSEKFSELLNQALSNYLKGMLTNEEVIQELLKLASQIKETEQQGNDLGLNDEEKAFYDALTRPQAVKDFYENDVLVAMTKELTETLRKNRTIDWQHKESARAGMRKMVKRLLKRYKYPPEEYEHALDIVLKQCEEWSDDDDFTVVESQPEATAQIVAMGMIGSVEKDESLKAMIDNMMAANGGTTLLTIVSECFNLFGERYFGMKQKDWFHVVKEYVGETTKLYHLQPEETFRWMAAESTDDK